MSKQTAIRGGERVSIYDVDSGLNNNRLICECCDESLIAKKGDTNRHHFAHQANSECVYNKINANGSGGVGAAHINAQNNFCKCYNDDKISMRIKYHPKCISGSMCKTWIEFDLKKRFPPNEYCIELEYYYKHHDNVHKFDIFDIAILKKDNITAPPVYNIEILNKHATEEKKRTNVEWVEICAKQVNDQIVCDGRIKPILFYECRRNNNLVETTCYKCIQYTEYQREKEKREQRKKEKREQEQREKEKQEQEEWKRQYERWEQEKRERKKKEQEEQEKKEQEQREQEQREREKKEQELNKWSEQVTKQMHQRNEKEKREQEKYRQQRQNIEILSNQLFERNPELFKTKDSPQLIGKYEKIAKKEIKSCIGCKSKRCLTCNLQITIRAKELLISDLLKISE